jgi:hypothetical protein
MEGYLVDVVQEKQKARVGMESAREIAARLSTFLAGRTSDGFPIQNLRIHRGPEGLGSTS